MIIIPNWCFETPVIMSMFGFVHWLRTPDVVMIITSAVMGICFGYRACRVRFCVACVMAGSALVGGKRVGRFGLSL